MSRELNACENLSSVGYPNPVNLLYKLVMPEISRFLGIVIRMYYRDHDPPHFHAQYGEHEITMEIDSGVVEGKFPRRALAAVLDWHELRQEELAINWKRARQDLPLHAIPPLE